MPYAHDCDAFFGWFQQALVDRKRTDRCRQIAAIAGPIDDRCIDCHLPEAEVYVAIRAAGSGNENHLAGA